MLARYTSLLAVFVVVVGAKAFADLPASDALSRLSKEVEQIRSSSTSWPAISAAQMVSDQALLARLLSVTWPASRWVLPNYRDFSNRDCSAR